MLLSPPGYNMWRVGHEPGQNRRLLEMSSFFRGMKVTTVFGEGTVVNLPVSNRIAVQYETGEIRYFWPEDVVTGRIRPAA